MIDVELPALLNQMVPLVRTHIRPSVEYMTLSGLDELLTDCLWVDLILSVIKLGGTRALLTSTCCSHLPMLSINKNSNNIFL